MRRFLTAIKFLTIIPVKADTEKKELAKSAAYFPLVGALIGLMLVIIDFVLDPVLPGTIKTLVELIFLIIITGALHLDGFLDSIDGLFSGKDKEKKLEIMKDSRVGSFGVIAVFCLLALKFLFLNEFEVDVRYSVLMLMPIVSRWTVVFACWKYPYARKTGTGEPFAKLVGKNELIIATLSAMIFSALFCNIFGLIIWFGAFLISFLAGKWINKKINGQTGDTYGAIIEITELAVLIIAFCIYYG